MIRKNELKEFAQLKGLSLANAEKDYLLELLLYFLSDHKRFLVFKGGTALYKFHNLNRFSEDLDLDLLKKGIRPDKEIERINRKLELLSMKGTIAEVEEHGKETNLRFTIRGPLYDGRKESMTRLTVNLSSRERPISSELKYLVSLYHEIPSFHMPVLDIREIAAEKIRCIFERDKPRDIYDLWFLSKRDIIPDLQIVNRKLSISGFTFDVSVIMEKIHERRKNWKKDLEGLIIGKLPEFRSVEEDLEKMVETIH